MFKMIDKFPHFKTRFNILIKIVCGYVTIPRRLIMIETGQINPVGDVTHILPEPGMVLP